MLDRLFRRPSMASRADSRAGRTTGAQAPTRPSQQRPMLQRPTLQRPTLQCRPSWASDHSAMSTQVSNSNSSSRVRVSGSREPRRLLGWAYGLAAGLVCLGAFGALEASALGEGRGDFGGDPTVGTLPIVTGAVPDLPGVDQVLYLYGPSDRVRAALGAARATDLAGEAAVAAFVVGGGNVWVEFHGEFAVSWDDPSALAGVEIGIGTGFEGGGARFAVETFLGTSGAIAYGAGHSFVLEPMRLRDAGLLERPVLLHGVHSTGDRSLVEVELTGGALTVRQNL